MSYLLHIDSSSQHKGSVSRAVGTSFLDTWSLDGRALPVIHRDLAATPVPHLSEVGISARTTGAHALTSEERDAAAIQEELVTEFLDAAAYLFTVPMYNLGVPSAFKAWLDQITIVGRTMVPGEPAGKRAVVISSRGGGYGPGTPNEGRDHVVPFLRSLMGDLLGLDVRFVVPELTMAAATPAMSSLVDLAEKSRAAAEEEAGRQARELLAALAPRPA
ncbi:FMN-dependent NADH-azoreductase [Streptomyces sp. TS71-3]|uniref:FMN-dependent NADH-azoreductase n=1 Tax=Streptomyces sp. TS71-3 TaxID=2733862 RepID=UPI001B134CD3|nr:NAD(P)H-dependent oxidoreductase [Streptomyces sp. TS71-3]GHJ37533.1 FMN-dependent NADH-azoreductase [Streptomyces sp. TS71-3]